MKNITILVILSAIVISCTGKKEISQSEPEKMVNDFFLDYEKRGPRESLLRILSSNKYISRSVADTVSQKLENLTNGLGDFQGYEKTGEAKYGQSIFILTYVVRYTQQPLRFEFKFYQPGNGLRLQNFSFESDFLDELEEVVKAQGIR